MEYRYRDAEGNSLDASSLNNYSPNANREARNLSFNAFYKDPLSPDFSLDAIYSSDYVIVPQMGGEGGLVIKHLQAFAFIASRATKAAVDAYLDGTGISPLDANFFDPSFNPSRLRVEQNWGSPKVLKEKTARVFAKMYEEYMAAYASEFNPENKPINAMNLNVSGERAILYITLALNIDDIQQSSDLIPVRFTFDDLFNKRADMFPPERGI